MTPKDCAVIILASGLSERFGAKNKLLARLDGKPVVSHVVDYLEPLSFAHHIAVVSNDPALSGRLVTAGYECVDNPEPKRGQSSSLALGIEAVLRRECHHALIVLGDMPFVTTDHIRKLFQTLESYDGVMSEFAGQRMPPTLLGREAMLALKDISGDRGGKYALQDLNMASLPLSPRAAIDIDSEDDLAEFNGP